MTTSSVDSSALTAEGTATYRRHVEEAASFLRTEVGEMPAVGVLGDANPDGLLDEDGAETSVLFRDIPHFPAAEGELLIGRCGGTPVAALEQTCHLYEGQTPRDVVFSVRMLARAGVETLLVPALARSVNPQLARGELMLVTDHINFQGQNPLVGPNVEEWGPRFPDMTEPYDPGLRQKAARVAREEGLSLQKGVYLALLGPGPETTAEHRMARRLGADVVGSGLVPEVLAARHMGVRVLGMTLIVDRHLTRDADSAASSGDGSIPGAASGRLIRLLAGLLEGLGADVTAS